MRKLAIGLAVVGLVVVVGGAYALVYGLQTYLVLRYKLLAETNAPAYTVPHLLQIESDSSVEGTRFSYYGWEFEVPWEEIDAERRHEIATTVTFKAGQNILFFNPEQTASPRGQSDGEAPQDANQAASLFPDKTIESDYAYLDAVFHTTPDQLSIFMPQMEAVQLSAVLGLKALWTSNSGPDLYSFETENLRGFQLGDPARTDRVQVYWFDPEGKLIGHFVVGRVDKNKKEKEEENTLSQAEISRIILTLRPVAEVAGE